jgi:hypothetical protein
MLHPNKDRFDYGEQLNAPDGYELDSAVATTYSLDLNALLAVSVALGFKDTLEGDLTGEKLLLLESIESLKGKLKVFYQKGKIKLPIEYNYLFALLEPYVSPVVPVGGEFSSFHPKLWLLRYVQITKSKRPKVRYKLIVLTRNLTFDKSWDLAASLDGVLVDDIQFDNKNNNWIDFILSLLKDAKKFKPAKRFKKELPYIKWKISYGRDDSIKLLPGGRAYNRPLYLKRADSLMIISPFIKDTSNQINALEWLSKQVAEDGEKILFSRAEELNAIGKDKLNEWKCYSINPEVVEGEEKIEEGYELHNLHAKLIVTQRGAITDWHLGSANATSAALGDINSSQPRNTEFMLRFSASPEKIGYEKLMEQLVGDEEDRGVFVKHIFEDIIESDDMDNSAKLRSAIFELINASWLLKGIIQEGSTKYTLTLDIRSKTLFKKIQDESIYVEVDQLAIAGAKQELCTQMQWTDMELTQISAFIPVSIRLGDIDIDDTVNILIQADIEIEGGDIRNQGILRKMLDSKDKILSYIHMLLNPEADKNEWLESHACEVSSNNDKIDIFDRNTPLFEQLMLTAARHKDVLVRLEGLIQSLEKSDIDIPEEFNALWKHFRVGV